MLLSVILYGSRARGDHRLSSDVDLLGIADTRAIEKENSVRGANLHLYPFDYLRDQSRRGSLFLSHLGSEGKALHDTVGAFEQIQTAFQYRDSYDDVIDEATFLALFILARKSKIQTRKQRQRLIWALRTMLIASAASDKKAVFSSAALEEFSAMEGLKSIIDRRNTIAIDKLVLAAKTVADKFGSNRILNEFPNDEAEQRAKMINSGGILENSIGLFEGNATTLKAPKLKQKSENYHMMYI
jgi:hypothetical protein